MTFAERMNEMIANKSREEQFSGVVLVKQKENLDVIMLGNQSWCAGSLVSGAKLARAAVPGGDYRVTPSPRTALGALLHHELA